MESEGAYFSPRHRDHGGRVFQLRYRRIEEQEGSAPHACVSPQHKFALCSRFRYNYSEACPPRRPTVFYALIRSVFHFSTGRRVSWSSWNPGRRLLHWRATRGTMWVYFLAVVWLHPCLRHSVEASNVTGVLSIPPSLYWYFRRPSSFAFKYWPCLLTIT